MNGTTFSVGLSDDTHLDDLEDIYLAEQALERLRRGEDEVVSAEAFWRGLGD
ncbi:CopG family transcriptional regulator [Spiribacter sp. 1M153]|uniref:CopG family transcriptional regulator n=1 Tax=Spiribacter roseus TaxID=1855875 RepID=UPI00349F968D